MQQQVLLQLICAEAAAEMSMSTVSVMATRPPVICCRSIAAAADLDAPSAVAGLVSAASSVPPLACVSAATLAAANVGSKGYAIADAAGVAASLAVLKTVTAHLAVMNPSVSAGLLLPLLWIHHSLVDPTGRLGFVFACSLLLQSSAKGLEIQELPTQSEDVYIVTPP